MKTLKQIQGDQIHVVKTSGDKPRMLKGIGLGSGGIGTNDYERLRNKPEIEGVELIGDKTFEELGLSSLSIDDLLDILR